MAPCGQAHSKMHLAALAVLTVFVIAKPAHQAFVSTSSGCRGIDARVQMVLRGSTPALCSGTQVPGIAHSWLLGSAALCCATAAVAMQALRCRSHLTQPRCRVVACQAMAAPLEQQVRSFPKVSSVVSGCMATNVVPCLLDMPASMFCTQAEKSVSQSSLAPVFMAAHDDEKVDSPAIRMVADITHRPARFVAGVRLAASTRARRNIDRCAARSARRAVGARLGAKVQYHEAQEPSFDSSRVRRQIQAGLQSSCHVRFQRAREFKTPAAADGGQAEHVLIKTFCLLDIGHSKTHLTKCLWDHLGLLQQFVAKA